MDISAKTKKLGIIGCPVEHSFSPVMHNYISRKMGADYVYTGYHVEPEDLAAAIAGMRALGIAGINVTAPHKKAVMEYLDRIDERAQRLGSVNTVVNRGGVLTGYNTDSDGFCEALERSGTKVRGSRILIMGCGGVVRPTLIRLIEEEPESVTIVNRTREKAERMAETVYMETGFCIDTDIRGGADIVINTTSAGMEPQEDALPWDNIAEIEDAGFIRPGMTVVSMIYNPRKTKFLAHAEARGAKTINGLGMLIYQGILAYELFTDIKLPGDMADMIKRDVFGAEVDGI